MRTWVHSEAPSVLERRAVRVLNIERCRVVSPCVWECVAVWRGGRLVKSSSHQAHVARDAMAHLVGFGFGLGFG